MSKPPLGSGARFAAMREKMAREGMRDPDAAAAAIGRRKYGSERMQKMAQHGKACHNAGAGHGRTCKV